MKCDYPHGRFYLTAASKINPLMEFYHLGRKDVPVFL